VCFVRKGIVRLYHLLCDIRRRRGAKSAIKEAFHWTKIQFSRSLLGEATETESKAKRHDEQRQYCTNLRIE